MESIDISDKGRGTHRACGAQRCQAALEVLGLTILEIKISFRKERRLLGIYNFLKVLS